MNARPSGLWRAALRRFARNIPAMAGAVIFLLLVSLCLLAPVLTDGDYISVSLRDQYAALSPEHPLGTDTLGRDLLTRLLYGGRITMGISLSALLLGAAAGTVIGLLCGYFGGRLDTLLMRIMEALSAIPAILLVVAVECALGWGSGNFLYAIALSLLPPFARVIRSAVMDIMGSEYIEAARALGKNDGAIITRHVLRNIAAPFLVQLSASAAEAFLFCTIIGYLGFGVRPPLPEWGGMVAANYSLIRSRPETGLWPCILVVLCSLSLNLMGNGLRDALAPGQRAK